DHTVYEAEAVGLVLGMELLSRERGVRMAELKIDNQVAIQGTLNLAFSFLSILDAFHGAVDRALRQHRELQLMIRWVPGHEGISGNERADTEAKEAARG
ncbi:hypothetical protein JAAARDRAFT_96555, partial [Jaapia argillacea MUCL 33604]